MADLPGLIAGAAQGHGLGIQFLKHLSRCRVLVHMIDLSDRGEGEDPISQFHTIEKELQEYSDSVSNKHRWLVFNKVDLLPKEQQKAMIKQVCDEINWEGPVYAISTVSRVGLDKLCKDILGYLVEQDSEHEQ
jgi:GTP-binding protein